MKDEIFPDIVELPLEDSLDLHSFPPKEAKQLVADYLREAYAAGFPEVRIIHGKGIGVQRTIVQAVAARDPHVETIWPAAEDAGGWGQQVFVLSPLKTHEKHKKRELHSV